MAEQLPIVAWRRRYLQPTGSWTHLSASGTTPPPLNLELGPQETEALTPHAPAQSALDEANAIIDQRNAMCSAYFAEVAELRREVEALRADAERYRWLRTECEKHGGLTIAKEGSWGLNPWSGDDPDRAIDTARASTDEGVGK